jgi:hypothetical protein
VATATTTFFLIIIIIVDGVVASIVAFVVDIARVYSVGVVDDLDLASRPTSVLNSYCCIASCASRRPRPLPPFPTHKFAFPC